MSLILSGTEGISGSAGVIDAETFAGQANTYYTDISARLGYTPLSNVNPSYSGTLTGNTGIINIGSGQFYKDANGQIGIGTSSPIQILEVAKTGVSYIRARSTDSAFTGVDFGQAASGEGRIIVRDSQPLTLYTAGTEKMHLTSSGNLGLGVTPSAWGSGWAPIQFSGEVTVSRAGIARNTYYDGSNYRYITTGTATLMAQSSGQFQWFNAPSGTAGNVPSFTQAMTLTAAGNLGVGNTNPGTPVDITSNSSAVALKVRARAGDDFGFIQFMNNAGSADWASVYALPNTLLFSTAGFERMRITSTGSVGIGVISPARSLVVSKGGAEGVEIGPGDTAGDPAGAVSFVYYNRSSSAYIQNIQDSSLHLFRINGSEMLRINSSGVSIGKTAASETYSTGNGFGFAAAKVDPFFSVVNVAATGGNACIYLNKRNLNSSNGLLSFLTNDGSSQSSVGSITHNGTNTAFNTSSDYRLKNIEGILTNSGSYIDSLRPVHGTWKVNGRKFIGLIAHEAQEVSQTDVATGEKDGKDMQAMDYSNSEFIANIIAELQSLRKRVAELESLKQ